VRVVDQYISIEGIRIIPFTPANLLQSLSTRASVCLSWDHKRVYSYWQVNIKYTDGVHIISETVIHYTFLIEVIKNCIMLQNVSSLRF